MTQTGSHLVMDTVDVVESGDIGSVAPTKDPDTVGKVILDPFMGGGTTVVEALRLGCKVIGIDLNPVAWFIVKTEVEPVEIEALQAAFDRLAERIVPWTRLPDGQGGKSVRETLLDQYKTTCPCCGNTDADIIYTFWVKSAVCTSPAPPCERRTLVPLFSDYIVAQKQPSIRYWRDATCPRCRKTFDWEVDPATLIAEPDLMISSSTYSAGLGRTTARWAYAPGDKVCCPWCKEEVSAIPAKGKLERKKVPLTVLLCPFCEVVWQWRGDPPEEVSCPSCHRSYKPQSGHVPDKGKFVCPKCGTRDAIIQSIRQLPEDQLLPMHPYAIQGYCARCGGNSEEDEEEEQGDLLGHKKKRKAAKALPDHRWLLTKSGGKFFTRIRPADLARYQAACATWEREKERLPYPKSEIPDGQETHRLHEHHYRFWHQMFNPRQLLCLSSLLAAVEGEQGGTLKEMLLSAFAATLNNSNVFSRYHRFSYREGKIEGVFSRHDYQPKLTVCENNVWGTDAGYGSFNACSQKVFAGKAFSLEPDDFGQDSKRHGAFRDPVRGEAVLHAWSSTGLSLEQAIDFVITDPPYGGNVNYSELSDFFYVWVRLVLGNVYPEFAPELTPKAEEIIKNPTRGKTGEEFEIGLRRVFDKCYRALKDDPLLSFTFHHAEGETWESLLRAVCGANFQVEAVYPVHGEAESSLHLLDKESAISYDLIHVCRKRPTGAAPEKRQWAGIRSEIRRRAREEIQAIEAGRYGRGLSPADVNIILIGKCLELYSRHYGAVMDQDQPFELRDALKEIRSLVDQLVSRDRPLPSELEDIDAESRIYLLTLCDKKEVKSDEVHKATRGILEPDDLMEAGLIIKGRAGRGRSYEVKQPTERFAALAEKFRTNPSPQLSFLGESQGTGKGRTYFVDYVHFLIALAEAGEPLPPWLERFRGDAPRLRAACDYLAARNKAFEPALRKIRDLLEPTPLFR